MNYPRMICQSLKARGENATKRPLLTRPLRSDSERFLDVDGSSTTYAYGVAKPKTRGGATMGF